MTQRFIVAVSILEVDENGEEIQEIACITPDDASTDLEEMETLANEISLDVDGAMKILKQVQPETTSPRYPNKEP